MIRPFHLDLTENEIIDIQNRFGEILRSGNLILGPYTEELEVVFARYIGSKYAIAVSSGTAALEILLTAKGARGNKIAVPTNTNFATVAAILRTGGTPVFMDMTQEYFVPNLDLLKITVEKYRPAGVMWVHIGGIVSPDFFDVVEYCKRERLFLIEDAAHAHGSRMGGVSAGAFADGGAFSFFPTKIMTTMEGGMLTTNSEEDAKLAKSFRNQGKRNSAFGGLHHDLGNSWRIPEIAAYMGIVQLAKLDRMLSVRNAAVRRVAARLTSFEQPYCDTSHMDQASQYKFIVRLKDHQSTRFVKDELEERGILCGGGVYDVPCHRQPVFSHIQYDAKDLAVCDRFCPKHICPPITSGTTADGAEVIAQALSEVLG